MPRATKKDEVATRVRWAPIPGSSQELAIQTLADQTLFCGTRGCGKTAAQLMCYLMGVGRGWGDAWTGIIFDTEYKPLINIISQSKKFFSGLGNGGIYRAGKDQYWEWPGGEKLYFRAAKTLSDARNYLGHEYGFIGYNELSKWPTSELYDHMLATLRTSSMDSDLHAKVFSTTNPYGPGAPWIKKRFVDPVPMGKVGEERFSVPYGNEGKKIEIVKTKICIRGRYTENPFFKPADVANLMEGVKGRPELEAAWLFCDWNATYIDGVVGDLWNPAVHILPNFKIPSGWMLNRTMDWGSTAPFAIGWFAESNGEDVVLENGKKLSIPRGSVVMFAEWYGSFDGSIGRNKGSKLAPDQIAAGVIRREHDFVENGWIGEGHRIYPGPADTQISGVIRTDISTIEDVMANMGVEWERADKSAGSRIAGLQGFRQALRHSIEGEMHGFYTMERCENTNLILPSLQRDMREGGEDIAPYQEDHLYDVVRYRLVQSEQGVPDVIFKYR